MSFYQALLSKARARNPQRYGFPQVYQTAVCRLTDYSSAVQGARYALEAPGFNRPFLCLSLWQSYPLSLFVYCTSDMMHSTLCMDTISRSLFSI